MMILTLCFFLAAAAGYTSKAQKPFHRFRVELRVRRSLRLALDDLLA
jgi:hypothetical protein